VKLSLFGEKVCPLSESRYSLALNGHLSQPILEKRYFTVEQ
jgi:hypothetical protein